MKNRELYAVVTKQNEQGEIQSGGCPEAVSLVDQIEVFGRALTAPELAKLLHVSKISIYKGCKAGRIPCFRILTNVRFDPKSVAKWLRKQ
jgi:predicted DNA-binding transcriptional regulator AlpA